MLRTAIGLTVATGLLLLLSSCGLISSEEEPELMEFPTSGETRNPDGQTLIPPTPEPPTPTPESTPTPAPPPGICTRTPGVQDAIIRRIEIVYCAQINEFELNRVDALEITTPGIEPGDLESMPNLVNLELTGIHFLLEPNFFREIPQLESLKINSTSPRIADREILSTGVFKDLTNLELLEINIERGWTTITLNEQLLDGLSNLRVIDVESVELVSPKAFDHMPKLQVVELHGIDSPALPHELLGSLQELREVRITGFRWPSKISLPTLELSCLALTGALEESMNENVHTTTVDDRKIELQSFTDNEKTNTRTCRLIVNDVQISEVQANLNGSQQE